MGDTAPGPGWGWGDLQQRLARDSGTPGRYGGGGNRERNKEGKHGWGTSAGKGSNYGQTWKRTGRTLGRDEVEGRSGVQHPDEEGVLSGGDTDELLVGQGL